MIQKNIFTKILSVALIFSFLFLVPLQVTSTRGTLAYSQVYAQGEGSQSGDGNSGGTNASSDGRDPTADFGGYTPDQVMGNPSLAQALVDAGSWVSGLAGLFGFTTSINFNAVTGLFETSRSRSMGLIELAVIVGGFFVGTTVISVFASTAIQWGARVIDSQTGLTFGQLSFNSDGVSLSRVDPNTGVATQANFETSVTSWRDEAERAQTDLDRQGASTEVAMDITAEGSRGREARVARGGSATLNWSADPEASCVGSGGAGWTGSKSPSGSQVIENLTKAEGFFLVCTKTVFYPGVGDNRPDSEVKRGIAYVEVEVDQPSSTSPTATTNVPQDQQQVPAQQSSQQQTSSTIGSSNAEGLMIAVNPTSVSRGGSARISWFASKARACIFGGGWPGDPAVAAATAGQDASGLTSVYGITQNTTYSITCTGDDGVSRTVSASVAVSP